MTEPIALPKTYKLFINGAFPRSERGRVLQQLDSKGNLVGNYAWATRKDFRNAVVAARGAQAGWAKRTAFNRSLILYRIGEILTDRRAQFVQKLVVHAGHKPQAAQDEVSEALNRLFFYAGSADKYAQILSSLNPVAGPFFNFTVPEPMGVVAAFAPKNAPLLGLIEAILPIVVAGNSCVLIVENNAPTVAIDFAEVLAVSDMPKGVINILTGRRDELLAVVAGHMDVNGLVYYGDDRAEVAVLERESAENIKRTHFHKTIPAQTLYNILPFIEFKTTWHPIGV